MKHSLVMSLCAVAVAAMVSSSALAQTDVALNLHYNDPADPLNVVTGGKAAGGTWELVAKTSEAGGLAGLSAIIDNVDLAGAAVVGPNSDISCNGNDCIAINGTVLNGVYGQDLTSIVNGIGTAGDANNQDDSLGNTAWDDVVVLLTGTFSGVRPELDPAVNPWGQGTAFNYFAAGDVLTAGTITTLKVRGDSLRTLMLEDAAGATGLLAGDTDRDNDVDIADLGTLAGSLPTGGTINDWDLGNTDGDDDVDIADLGALAGSLVLSPGTPAAVSAVPEPSSIALLLFGVSALAFRRRK